MKRIVLLCVSIFSLHPVYAVDQKPDCRSYIKYRGVRHCVASKNDTDAAAINPAKEIPGESKSRVEPPFSIKTFPAAVRQEMPPLPLEKENVTR
jgi:hypothetical protein